MSIVSLNQAAKLTGKSTSVLFDVLKNGKLKGNLIKNKNGKTKWEINTDDLFVLYPQIAMSKTETNKQDSETELAQAKETILALENKLKDEIAKREHLEQLYQANEVVPHQGTMIEITYGEEVSPGLIKGDQDEKQQIENLLNFIQVSNLTDNYKVLDIFRRVLGSYIVQRKNQKSEEFSYHIKDNIFYHYMMFSNPPEPLSDSNWQCYLQNEFSEKLADYDLYARD